MDNGALPSRLLIEQHRRIDDGIKGIVDGNGQLEALAESLRLLRLHIYVEENYLFPPLEASGVTMPVFVMKQEHGEMWPYLQTLTTACESETPVKTLHGSALWLFRLLQVHNPKEEEVVYTAADRLAAENPDSSLIETLETTRIPDDWVCAMAPG